jgi:ATP-dependent Lon protease
MVFTRSQKRKFENIDLDLNEGYSGINMFKRKRTDNRSLFLSDSDTETDATFDGSEVSLDEDVCISLTKLELQQLIESAIKQIVQKLGGVENENDNGSDNEGNIEDDDIEEQHYKKFMKHIDSIHSGDFFQREPLEDKKRTLKKNYTSEQIKQLNSELSVLRNLYKENAPSIVDILQMDIHHTHKQKLLEKVYNYTNSEMLTPEYNSSLKHLLSNINKTQNPELFKLEQEIMISAQSDEMSDNYRQKILKSKMSFDNKVIAYKRLEMMERYEDSDSSEYAKIKNWMDSLLSVPFGNYKKTPCITDITPDEASGYMRNVRDVLDQRLSFLEKPKDQIVNVVTQMVRNPESTINAIGLYGSPGVGKTAICKSIAEALGRPYRCISLGGESDSSVLTGYGFTYVGSSPGRLIELLNETKCMNPVILIDELDKVSQTQHGKEIIGNLIHLTDSTTNAKYNYDRYFAGIEFDLSKVLFVFTYNDPTKVDRILADRLYKIKVDNYTSKEKLEITNKHLIRNILDEYKFSAQDLKFSPEAVNYVVNESRLNEGMRDIKRKFQIIVSRINTLLLTEQDENIVRLKYKSLYSHYKQFPVEVLKEHIDVLLHDSISNDCLDKDPPFGMYS